MYVCIKVAVQKRYTLTRPHTVEQTHKQTHKQTNNKPTNQLTNQQTSKQTSKQASAPISKSQIQIRFCEMHLSDTVAPALAETLILDRSALTSCRLLTAKHLASSWSDGRPAWLESRTAYAGKHMQALRPRAVCAALSVAASERTRDLEVVGRRRRRRRTRTA